MKQGLVYRATAFDKSWAADHAMLPTPFALSSSRYRVFVTFCDRQGRGRPGFVDVDFSDSFAITGISPKPLLDLGRPGTFDDNGVVVTSVLSVDSGVVFMYYVGFELCTQIRYRLLTGLAISEDGGATFRKYSEVPILERSAAEGYFRCGPWVIRDDLRYRMWYVAGSAWEEVGDRSLPVYNIRYMESTNGIDWPEQGEVILDISDSDEHGLGRPCVIAKPGGGYRMFYSVRRRSVGAYRLGYAESDNSFIWERKDSELQLSVSSTGFDSEAIMYAVPLQFGNDLFILYNGNDFGREGFGIARLEEE